MRAATVELRRLAHSYATRAGSLVALEDVSIAIAAGEFVCLLGPSGCGKSTLLRAVAGLLRPSAGLVKVVSRQPDGWGLEGSRIGWMAQQDGLLPWRDVAANVSLPLELLDAPRREVRLAVERMLRLVGLEEFAHSYPHQLSGGMRQRAALARALVHCPGLLLLDEPFAHLDELTRDELGDELVRLWADERPTVLMVTHSPVEAVRLAERVIILSARPGRVVGEVRTRGPQPGSLRDPATLAALEEARALLAGLVRSPADRAFE